MTSERAASWLIETYPLENLGWGDAMTLAAHRSWKTADQMRLANFYLRELPHASEKAYETFLSFMSVRLFLGVIKGYLPALRADLDLLLYYLIPALKQATKGEADQKSVEEFLSALRSDDPGM